MPTMPLSCCLVIEMIETPSSGVVDLDSPSRIVVESLGLVAFQGIQYIRKATFRDEIDGLAGWWGSDRAYIDAKTTLTYLEPQTPSPKHQALNLTPKP